MKLFLIGIMMALVGCATSQIKSPADLSVSKRYAVKDSQGVSGCVITAQNIITVVPSEQGALPLAAVGAQTQAIVGGPIECAAAGAMPYSSPFQMIMFEMITGPAK